MFVYTTDSLREKDCCNYNGSFLFIYIRIEMDFNNKYEVIITIVLNKQ